MATVTFQLTSCSAGGHVEIEASVGGKTFIISSTVDALREEITPEDVNAAFMTILRWAIKGLTPAQAKQKINGLQVIL